MEDHREAYEPEKTLAGYLKGTFSEDRVAKTVQRCGFTEEDLKVQIKAVSAPKTGTVQISVPKGKSAPKKHTPKATDVKLDRPSLPEGKSGPSGYIPRIADVKLGCPPLPEGRCVPRDCTPRIADVKLDCPALPEGKIAPKKYTPCIADVKLGCPPLPEGKIGPSGYIPHIAEVKLDCPPLSEGKCAPNDYTPRTADVMITRIELPAIEDGSHIGPLSVPELREIRGVTVAGPFAEEFPVFLPLKQTPIEAPVELVQACLDTVDDLIDQILCGRW